MTGQRMDVTPERLRKAGEVFLKHAQLIREHGMSARAHGRHLVGLCGGDPISPEARDAFEAKIDEFAISPAKEFTRRLQDMADHLAATAAAYEGEEARNRKVMDLR